ncbi:MAG: VWA domain-containing protein [Planctomycetes bacterium]|nr:VWA domain-containing protein [Planctomycetota bacterium]
MRKLALLPALLGVLAFGALAQEQKAAPRYVLKFDPAAGDVVQLDRDKDGKTGIFFQVKFSLTLDSGAAVEKLEGDFKLVLEEDGKIVKIVDVVPKPVVSQAITTVALAIDTSGSMKEHRRMEQARLAAEVFLRKLPAKSDCGLLLFDHETRKTADKTECRIDPILAREPLLAMINQIEPRGGTAYLDAGVNAIRMVRGVRGRDRAVVLMTDGIDINSKQTIDDVIREAKKDGAIDVRVYTIGIGEPGKFEKVNTVLVLDHSGSMKPPANDVDTLSKIESLHRAAHRYVESMSTAGRVSLIPFSTSVGRPRSFQEKKDAADLKKAISRLEPRGETALFDATYDAICTLEADNAQGRRAVVAMTDGYDNTSRRRVEEVIERAKDAKIPLYLLGFGRDGEIDDKTMRRMADETGGKFYHAKTADDLINIFENLSIQLHDDGIDEYSLKRIARETGGQYFPVKDANKLKVILEEVGKTIQRETFESTIVFPSHNQRADGKQRNVTLRLIRGGKFTYDPQTETYQVQGGQELESRTTGQIQRGLVIAEMNHVMYLVLLVGIGALIALPGLLRRASPA